jgi:hypothetical protein
MAVTPQPQPAGAGGRPPDGRAAPPSTDLLVIGLGYVGLPLAREAAFSGFRVVGYDLNTEVVAGLNAGRSHVGDVPPADIAEMLARGVPRDLGGGGGGGPGHRGDLRAHAAVRRQRTRPVRGPGRGPGDRAAAPARHARGARVDHLSRDHR